MTQTIASDNLLSAAQREILDIVLDQMIPEDTKRSKPSAAEVGVFEYIAERNPQSLLEIGRQLDKLDALASSSNTKPYAELTRETQDEILNRCRAEDSRFLLALALQTVECYYLDSRVMTAIGLPSRPPYPDGYSVHRGDLTLLDPVRERGQVWRRT